MFQHLAYIDPSPVISVGGGILAGLIAVAGVGIGVILLLFRRLRQGFRKHWAKVLLAIAVLLAGAWLLWRGCRMKNGTETEYRQRIILIGLDALSPEIMEPMLAAGELPNFQRLREMGGYARLATTNPAQSPVAWTGFATGRNPGKHGLFDFIRRDPKTYMPEIGITRLEGGKPRTVRRGKAFWDYCSAKNVPVTILRCPVTFPPDKVKGKMLSGMGTPDLLGTQGTFSFYTTEKIDRAKDIGGEVIEVRPRTDRRADKMTLELLGPYKKSIIGKTERVKVEFTVTPRKDSAHIELQSQNFDLELGKWSDWQYVAFRLGTGRRMPGIVKFLLVELEPEFKLYVSPISIDPAKPYFPISYPKDYSNELAAALGCFATRGMPFDTWALSEGRIDEKAFLAQAEELLQENLDLMAYELFGFKQGVFFCYFEYPDVMQHMFWRYRDPGHPLYEPEAPAKYKSMITEVYRRMDQLLGQVLRRLRKDDVLLVFSDHGFCSFRRSAHINSWLRDNGYMALEQDEGRELFQDVDWSKTKAYALGFGGIYLNLKDREGEGIVKPGAEAEALEKEIAEKLQTWQDPKTGEAIINTVYTREEIFQGQYAEQAPDLYIGFKKNYRASWQTALGAAPKPLIEDNLKKWSGTHLVDPKLVPGVLFTNRKLTVENPKMYDLAPTILKLIGLNGQELKNADLDGESLF